MSKPENRIVVAATTLVCFFLVTLAPGCRALSKEKSRNLPTARNYSLHGADLLQQRKYDEAEKLFVEALRHSPNDERAQWGYAEVLWNRGNHALATRHMMQAVELSGSNPELQVRLGRMFLEQQDYPRAVEMAEQALKNRHNDPTALALKGDVLRATGKLQEAIACYQLAMLYRPDWPEVQVAVAELYRLTGNPSRALATLDRMGDQRSESQIPPRAFLLRAQALADMGAHQAALTCLRSAAPKLPASESELLVEFGQLSYQLGDLVEAQLCLNRALQTQPNHAIARRLQSELDQQLERPTGVKVPIGVVSQPMRRTE